jgi:hypothetical protein
MNSAFGTDVLGLDALPSSIIDAAPDRPPAPETAQPNNWESLTPELIAALRTNIRPDGAGRFSAALGAGLASAGQNWNKPALAAFASGAGAAIEGADKAQQQLVHNQIAALNAAIHAFRAGDMIAYHRSLADYHRAVSAQRRHAAPPRPAKPAPDAAAVEPIAPVAAPLAAAAAPGETAVVDASADPAVVAQQAEPDPQQLAAHRATLERLLGEAGVPADRIEPQDLAGAARLMAAKALPPHDAFETAVMHGALTAGHASPADIDFIYGPGAADAIRSAATS